MKFNKKRLMVFYLLLCFLPFVLTITGAGRFLLYSCFPPFELMSAITHGDTAGIEHAISRGANVNAHNSYAGRTALMVAAIHGQTKMAAVLIAHGADINARDDLGNTAFMLAQKEKHFDTAALLSGH